VFKGSLKNKNKKIILFVLLLGKFLEIKKLFFLFCEVCVCLFFIFYFYFLESDFCDLFSDRFVLEGLQSIFFYFFYT
jgi:hypothetical protein